MPVLTHFSLRPLLCLFYIFSVHHLACAVLLTLRRGQYCWLVNVSVRFIYARERLLICVLEKNAGSGAHSMPHGPPLIKSRKSQSPSKGCHSQGVSSFPQIRRVAHFDTVINKTNVWLELRVSDGWVRVWKSENEVWENRQWEWDICLDCTSPEYLCSVGGESCFKHISGTPVELIASPDHYPLKNYTLPRRKHVRLINYDMFSFAVFWTIRPRNLNLTRM